MTLGRSTSILHVREYVVVRRGACSPISTGRGSRYHHSTNPNDAPGYHYTARYEQQYTRGTADVLVDLRVDI